MSDQQTEEVRETFIPFDEAVKFGPTSWDGLALKEPTGRQLAVASEYGFGKSITSFQMKLISEVSGVPFRIIEGLRISQIKEAYDFLEHFTSQPQKNGGPLSET